MRRGAIIGLTSLVVLALSAGVFAYPALTAPTQTAHVANGSNSGATPTSPANGPDSTIDVTHTISVIINNGTIVNQTIEHGASPPENESGNISVNQSISVNNTAGSVTVNGTTNVTKANHTVVNVTFSTTSNWTAVDSVAFEGTITFNGTTIAVNGTVEVNVTAGMATVTGDVLVERNGQVVTSETFVETVTWTDMTGLAFVVRTTAGLILEVTVIPGEPAAISLVAP